MNLLEFHYEIIYVICKKSIVNYLTVESISKSYGELELFSNLSFSIHKDDKIAFVAKNGSGKTSILNILSGNYKKQIWENKDKQRK